MSKQGTTWYVVADGGKARILTGEPPQLHTAQTLDPSGHDDASEASATQGVSQLKAPKAEPHEQAKANFAKRVAQHLNEAVRTGKVDALVLAAPAHMLHDIREALDKPASAALKDTQSKDLTNIPDNQLGSHFG
jgi:protein required for attachment to host cells